MAHVVRSEVRLVAAVLAAMLWTGEAFAANYRWNVDADGDWTVPGNWTLVSGTPNGLGYPNAVDDVAELTDAITANRTITIPDGETITLGGLLIDDDNNYVIASGTGVLVFDNVGTASPLTVTNINGDGAHIIGVAVQLNKHLEITSTSSGLLTLERSISESGGARNLSVTADSGGVRLAPDVNNAYTGSTLVLAGTLELAGTSSAQAIIGVMTIGGGAQTATVTLIASDQIAASATVTVSGNGVLDINGQSDSLNLAAVTNGTVTIGTGTLTTGFLTLTGATITSTGAGQLILLGNVVSQPSTVISTIAGTVNLNGNPRMFVANPGAAEPDLIIDGRILTGTFIKHGDGTLRLTGAGDNTFTGANAGAGLLELAKPAGTISISSNLHMGNGLSLDGAPTVRVLTSEQIVDGAALSMMMDGNFQVNGAGITETIASLSISQAQAGIISGQLIVGTLSLLDCAVTIGATGVLTIAGSVTNAFDHSTISGGTLNLGDGGTRTFTTDVGANINITSIITGTATLSKNGGGVLSTSAVNTFSGTTTIVAGSLAVTGSHAFSAVSLGNGLLGGTGTVGSISSTGANGTFSPGGQSGLPSMRSGSVSLAPAVTFTVGLRGVGEGDWQKVVVTGTVALNNASLATGRMFTPQPGSRFTIVDNDGADPIVGTFAGLAEGAEIDISGVTVKITYAGGDGNDVEVFREDDPPTLATLNDLQINEDAAQQTVNLTVNDDSTDPSALVLTAQSSNQALVTNAGLTFGGSGTARTLLFTPVANAYGTSTITVRVTDNSSHFVERTFVLTVNAVNDEPTLQAIGPQTTDEDETLVLQITFNDIDDVPGDVNVTAESFNQDLVSNVSVVVTGTGTTRTLSVTPLINQNGQVNIGVKATDGELTTQQIFTLTITAVNDAPTIDGIGPQVIDEDGQANPLFTFFDPDDPSTNVIFTATSSNQQLVTDASLVFGEPGGIQQLTVKPVANASGTATITVHATDGKDPAQRTFLVTVNPVNDAPTISAIGPQTINEDTSLAPQIFFVDDPDGNLSSLTVTAASSNQALVPNANVSVVPCTTLCSPVNAWHIAATPIANAFGTTTITLTVSDGTLQGSTSFVLTVNSVADPGEPTPPITYILAEGATGGFFDTDLLIANPNTSAAPITLTFLKQDGSTVVETRNVAARSHMTIHVDELPGLEATAAATTIRSDAGLPLAVERTMFWNESRYGGHTDAAVAGPSQSWVFGEGAQGFFDTYLLIANPNNGPADLTLTFLREGEAPFVTTRSVGALSRLTIHAAEYPELQNRSFGISVEATQPVNAERATYFATTPTRLWSGGQASAGVAQPSTSWFLAEGATGPFFDTFILLGNPGDAPANVGVKFLLDTGEAVDVTRQVPARGRVTIPVDMEPDPRVQAAALSTVVTSDVPIVAERSMYWPTGEASPWGEAHHAVGLTGTSTRWALAEGRVGGAFGYVTYILLANPSSTAAQVNITYLRENGTPIVRPYTVPPTSRVTVDVGGLVTELQNQLFGAVIEVTNGVGIAVERAMYWTSDGIFLAGGTGATATRLP
jgi:autotransporter-associated beta strand protein